ncbi:hypothetical protein M0R45_009939 [Rubus argutus]|uniref:F-box domain-containing protein n=1 Tax=Rubus argutus TaxID=59490 RepID=A0AAW1Y682_RUBAR
MSKRKRQQHKYTYGCWQNPPEDIMEKIIQHLSLDDRLRLSFVCKHWQSFATRRDMRSAPQLPLLVLPHPPNCQVLSFASLSKGEVVCLNMPKPVRGVFFHTSSKGWLIMFIEKGKHTQMFLLNPLSGVQHKLPPLKKNVTFDIGFRKWKDHARQFVDKIVLSSPDISECMVAAFFNNHGLGVDHQELGFCRPGDKRWIVFNYFDTCIGVKDILFSGNTLYALLLHNDDTKSGTVVAHTLTFGDHVVELKFIYDIEATMNRYVVHDSHNSYMLESSINNEVFLIHQILDHTYPNPDPYQDIDQEDLRLSGTTRSGFIVYKFDFECGNHLRVQSLGDQTIFLAANSSSLSFRASDFKELDRNCIYFVTDEMISISYLDTGKIRRLFPDVDDLKGQKGWFTPSLW